MSLKTDIDQLVADAAIVHDWAHGNASHSTTMGGVPVRSPAKLIADLTVSEAAAAGSATAAAGSATAASGSATSASTSATSAAASATAASSSQTAAAASANTATTQAGIATTQASNASSSAAAAAASAAVINLTAPGPIGGTTPAAGAFTVLTVTGAVNATGLHTVTGNSLRITSTSDGSNGILFFRNQSGVDTMQLFAGPNEIVFYSPANVSQKFFAGELERLRITPSGNLLINTTTDDGVNKLQVNGGLATTTINTAGYTVATLPAAGTAGRRAYVTDATAPTFLGALTGGGAVKCPVFDNGVAWVAG